MTHAIIIIFVYAIESDELHVIFPGIINFANYNDIKKIIEKFEILPH